VTAPLLPSLVGATACGKTSVAVEVARRLGLEIVSADSRQVYRRLDVGTAKPTADERAAVPHHLIDVAGPEETYTAARFAREAEVVFSEIRGRGRIPFLVGGSGLYLRAAEEGLFEGPAADDAIRARLAELADRDGEGALHRRLADVDPDSATRLHPNDRVRVIRALEVHAATGIALSEHHRRHRESRPAARFLRFGLSWPTPILDARIAGRVDAMLAAGWADEVRGLLDAGLASSPALDALGYPEMAALVRGEIDEGVARERIVRSTRQFAKRQRTWFRAVADVHWIERTGADDGARVAGAIADAIAAAARGAAGAADEGPAAD
jgi:tRNA dimethylallyltransferase